MTHAERLRWAAGENREISIRLRASGQVETADEIAALADAMDAGAAALNRERETSECGGLLA